MDVSLNSSDDNPAVILDVSPSDISSSLERSYYIQAEGLSGAIIPSGNFEPITWVVTLEELGIALCHASHNSVLRMIHLVDSHLTQLSRFLAPDEKSIAFGTIQKSFLELDTEIRSLANPVSMDFFPAAGNIEDHATNASLAAKRMGQIVDNLIYISAIEIMHAAQAMDLRLQKNPNLKFGTDTKKLFKEFRQAVPFLDKDRVLNLDIQNAYEFLKNRMIKNPPGNLEVPKKNS